MQETSHCEKCGLRYKRSQLDREGLCKSCRSAGLKASSGKKPPRRGKKAPVEHDQVSCPECFEKVSPQEPFCPKCFASMQPDGDDYGFVEYRSRASMQVREKARKIQKRLLLIRWLVGLQLGFLGFGLFAIGLFWLQGHEVPITGWKYASQVVQLILVADLFVSLGSIHVRARGYILFLACVYSFFAVLLIQSGLGQIAAVMAVVYWTGFAALNDIYRLRAQHPEAFDLGRKAGGFRFGSAAARAADRNARDRQRMLSLAGIVALVVILGAVGFRLWNAPPAPEVTIDGFQAAWNSNSKEAVASFALEGRQAKWVRRLERRDKALEWAGSLPKMSQYSMKEMGKETGWVTFSGPEGSLRARFTLLNGRWLLQSLDYRGLE